MSTLANVKFRLVKENKNIINNGKLFDKICDFEQHE